MLSAIMPFKRSIGVFLTAFGIFWLPKDVQDYQEAAKPWREFLAMLDQNTALWAFAAVLVSMILWSDGRRFLGTRRKKQAEQEIAALLDSRTRLTIREAASIAVGVSPSAFEQSEAAQSEANEMLFYARKALILPADMSEHQHTLMRQGRPDHGFDLDGVSFDTFITRDELATYMSPGWKTWLPILDKMNRDRA